MKLRICLLLLCCFVNTRLFAQTAKEIEADFTKSFDKLNYLRADTVDINSPEKLIYANSKIEEKLEYYTRKVPSAMSQAFVKCGGLVSDGGLFRTLSWDTLTGGTQHVFENIIQYRPTPTANFITISSENQSNYVYNYDKLYTLNVNGKNYYLVTYYGIFDLYIRGEGIRVFSIENGKLNAQTKLIKTKKGLTNKLYYTYDQQESNLDVMGDATLTYDSKLKTITFPVVVNNGEEGKLTDNFITYKFTGQYFEKVKS